ncbi:bleomycin resistance protein [Paenibacillus sp. TAB 01]|uniref:bleomycin resistance protein n=1 Tax=Paenibacillus sp. TAB 01 TaxID=3368988 RepID=UPI0037510B8B
MMFRLNALVPELSVSDINRSLNFYLNILYFKLEYQRPENKFAMISLDGCQIMIEEINGHWQTGELSYPFGRGINFQITVSNINEIYSSLKKHNYPIMIEIQENWYRADTRLVGQKEFLIIGPRRVFIKIHRNLGGKRN